VLAEIMGLLARGSCAWMRAHRNQQGLLINFF
jgi:hypothetical protein